LPFCNIICYGLCSAELERCVSDFLKLTKHHLSAFKVSLAIHHSIHALGYYVSILFCIICKFCIYQEVLSPSIESIQTYVDNLAVLNSRYCSLFLFCISHTVGVHVVS
jgi:uncharacterized membrane protein